MKYPVAHLTKEEEKKLKNIEAEMNVILIAYDQQKNSEKHP